jgi:hypothetical protein
MITIFRKGNYRYMPTDTKLQKFWVYVVRNEDTHECTIDLKPYYHHDETTKTEPHRFCGMRSFSSFQEGMAQADRLFGVLDWRRMGDFNCQAPVELICRKPKRR